MPIFLDGYQTTLGSRSNLHKLSDSLNESLVRDNLIASSLDVKKVGSIYPVFVTALQDSEALIPAFTHPFYLRTKLGKEILATDIRLFLKPKMYDGRLASLPNAIRQRIDYEFTRARAILNLEWIQGDVETLKSTLWFSSMMFSRWIAEALAREYALDPRDQTLVSIAASYYYQFLFTDAKELDEDTFQKWVIHTTKTTFADARLIEETFKKMPEIKRERASESLIDAIKASSDNVRLNNLSLLTLLTLLKNSWYATNAKEIIAISVEHPPTWMSIVFAVLQENSYRSTMVFKIAERMGKRGISEEYLKTFRQILKEYTITETHYAMVHAGIV